MTSESGASPDTRSMTSASGHGSGGTTPSEHLRSPAEQLCSDV
jgi:hypothetical protein